MMESNRQPHIRTVFVSNKIWLQLLNYELYFFVPVRSSCRCSKLFTHLPLIFSSYRFFDFFSFFLLSLSFTLPLFFAIFLTSSSFCCSSFLFDSWIAAYSFGVISPSRSVQSFAFLCFNQTLGVFGFFLNLKLVTGP